MKKILSLEIIISILVFVILMFITFNTNTVGDTGDSLTHYLFARYSLIYPHFFLDHWAKPVYVLLATPFAQFGFKGIEVFNCICATLTALFTFYTARNLKIKNNWLVFILILFSPLYFKLIFSGLTEYLFGLILILGIYFSSRSRDIIAIILISFLPLVRSEGLIIVGVFGIYYFLNKKYKLLPFLMVGQVIYTMIGAFYYKDLMWVVNKIPYANLDSPYGKGQLFDFVHRLNYVIEKPIYLLLIVGVFSMMFLIIKKGWSEMKDLKTILILGSFLCYFVAHAFFWWQGIFNSMGLPRVLNAIVPLIALISLIGLQNITDRIENIKFKKSLLTGIAVIICLFPFTNRVQGVVFEKDMFVIKETQLIDEEVVPYIKQYFPEHAQNTFYFSQPYFCLGLDIDYFNADKHREMQHLTLDQLNSNAIVLWDDWYSVIQGGVSLEQMIQDDRFELIKSFQRQENERLIEYKVFVVSTKN